MTSLTIRKILLLIPFNPRDALYCFLNKTSNDDIKIILDAACGHGGNAIVTRYRNHKITIIGFDIFFTLSS
jgi:methylase of polypeptide subunit release factors